CVIRPSPTSTRFPYTTLFRSHCLFLHRQDPFADPQTAVGEDVPAQVEIQPEHGVAQRYLPQEEEPGEHLGAVQDERQRRMPHVRSEEHTSELQSRENLVCRLL